MPQAKTDELRAKMQEHFGDDSLRDAYDDGVVARDSKISREACPYPVFDRSGHRDAWLRGYDYAVR